MNIERTNKKINSLIDKLKGVYTMNKKKFTSWGVSFTSLALVAGMISYLGITNKDTTSKTNTVAQAKVSQTSTTGSNQSSSISYELPNQNANNSDTEQTTQTNSTDQSFSGQHGNFDTTTGGT